MHIRGQHSAPDGSTLSPNASGRTAPLTMNDTDQNQPTTQQLSMLLGIYEEMMESAHDGMLLVENNLIIGCNPAACALYGLSKHELIGMHPGQLSPEYQPDGEASALKAERYMAAAMAGRLQRFYWRHLRRGKGEFTAEVSLNPARSIELPGLGLKPRYVSIVRDVTAEQNTLAALRDSEIRFRQLFEQAPVALALVNGNEVLALNRHWHTLFGYQSDEITTVEDWWRQAYPDPEYQQFGRKAWDVSLKEMESSGSIRPNEYRVRCADGRDRHVLIGGAIVGQELMVSFYDTTEQHLAQQALAQLNNELENRVERRTAELQTALDNLRIAQEDLIRSEKLAGLGALVAGIAHELNTPIGNAVMVASSLQLMEKELRRSLQEGLKRSTFEQFLGELQESTDIIERNLRRAAELISSFKQVAVDQSSYQRRPFDLSEVLHELRLTMTPTLRKAGVQLHEHSEPGLHMDSFPGPLTQVLMNIVNNAVMHAFTGHSDRQISISADRASPDQIRIVICDNGCGIEPAHQSRIFDPFFTTKLGQGGSGLGLHIVYTLVTGLLGGRISLTSQSGQGARFELLLPADAPASDPTAPERNTV